MITEYHRSSDHSEALVPGIVWSGRYAFMQMQGSAWIESNQEKALDGRTLRSREKGMLITVEISEGPFRKLQMVAGTRYATRRDKHQT